jgi:hypothetical protein
VDRRGNTRVRRAGGARSGRGVDGNRHSNRQEEHHGRPPKQARSQRGAPSPVSAAYPDRSAGERRSWEKLSAVTAPCEIVARRPVGRRAGTALYGPLLRIRADIGRRFCRRAPDQRTPVAPDGDGSAEIEQGSSGLVRYLGVATIAGALVRRCGGGQVALLFEQRAEVERAAGVGARLPTPVGLDRPAPITLAL